MNAFIDLFVESYHLKKPEDYHQSQNTGSIIWYDEATRKKYKDKDIYE